MIVIEVIPFKTFKERIQIVKKYAKSGVRVRIYKTYIYIERIEGEGCANCEIGEDFYNNSLCFACNC